MFYGNTWHPVWLPLLGEASNKTRLHRPLGVLPASKLPSHLAERAAQFKGSSSQEALRCTGGGVGGTPRNNSGEVTNSQITLLMLIF